MKRKVYRIIGSLLFTVGLMIPIIVVIKLSDLIRVFSIIDIIPVLSKYRNILYFSAPTTILGHCFLIAAIHSNKQTK